MVRIGLKAPYPSRGTEAKSNRIQVRPVGRKPRKASAQHQRGQPRKRLYRRKRKQQDPRLRKKPQQRRNRQRSKRALQQRKLLQQRKVLRQRRLHLVGREKRRRLNPPRK